jgi:hypothetical protein
MTKLLSLVHISITAILWLSKSNFFIKASLNQASNIEQSINLICFSIEFATNPRFSHQPKFALISIIIFAKDKLNAQLFGYTPTKLCNTSKE